MFKIPFKLRKPKAILVCETDGFLLRAAVYMRTGNELSVLQTAESQQADMAEAVADVIKSLKADGWKGKNAVLLSPTVLSTLIELPVDPKKPRSLAHMNELIRWEAEPLLVQHTTQCSVGNLLIARGYMTKEQADAVMDLQQGRSNPAGGLELMDKFSLRRFGDLAVELGYIKRSQLNACLAGQEWLKSNDDLIECGWSAQGDVSDIPGTYHWQVSAVTQSLLQRWTTVFQMQGVTLQAMYPLTGSSVSLLSHTTEEQVLIESHADMSFALRTKDNNIIEQNLYLDSSKSPLDRCLEAFHSLNTNTVTAVKAYLSNWSKNNHSTHKDLATALGGEVINIENNAITEKSSPGMVGAGLHYLEMSKNNWVSNVRMGGPLPTLLHRPNVRGAILLGVITLLILVAETTLLIRGNIIESHKNEIDTRWQVIHSAMKRINGDIKQVEQRKKELKARKSDQQRQQQRFTFFGEELPERASLVQTILGILQESVNENILVNSIDENKRRTAFTSINQNINKRVETESFNLKAWALSETAAQQFIQTLKELATPWGLEILDSNVVGQLGPVNLQGFMVTLRIVKLANTNPLVNKAP